MKKVAFLLAIVMLLCAGPALAEADFATDVMELTLPPNGWINVTEAGDEIIASFINGDLVFLAIDVNDILVGNEEYDSIFNQFNDELKLSFLMQLQEHSFADLEIQNELCALELADGLLGCYGAYADEGQSFAVANILSGRERWTLLCYDMGDVSQAPCATLLEVIDGISLRASGGQDTPDAGADPISPPQSGYEIPEVPMVVHISEEDMNIFTDNTPEDSLSLARISFPKDRMDLYVSLLENTKFLIGHKDDANLDFSIQITVKDEHFPDLTSWEEASEEEIDAEIRLMFAGMLNDYTLYRTDCGVFALMDLNFEPNSMRYGTVHNGDMIYVKGRRTEGALTDDDLALMKAVVDAIEFTDGD